MKKELGIFILLVVICVFMGAKYPQFLSSENLQNTGRLIGIYGIFSIGLGLVIITGGIDLSVGSVMAVLGVVLSIMLVDWQLPLVIGAKLGFLPEPISFGIGILLTVIVAVAIPTLVGLINGLLITKARIQPFIVTLCGLLFYRGLARYITNDETKGFGNAQGFESLKYLATGSVFGIPMQFVLLIVIAVIMWIVLHRTVYGRYLFAVGRNEEASKYSGINTHRIIMSAYVICGILVGISGILFAFYTNSISPSSHGQSYELYGIAAAVLGGCSLRGGEGSIIGILIGTVLLRVLQNLVTLAGVPSSLELAVMGLVILIGVIVDQLLKYLSARTPKAVA